MSIRRRLTIFHALTILAFIALMVGTLVFVLLRAVPSTVEETARAAALDTVNTLTTTGTLTAADRQRISAGHAAVVVRDAQGKVLSQIGHGIPAHGGADTPIWQRALAGRAIAQNHVEFQGIWSDAYIYAVPLQLPGQPVRVVEGAMSYRIVGSHYYWYLLYVGIGAIATLLLAIGASYLLARAALSPVEAIVRSARQITESDLSRRLPVKTPQDELGRLAMTFNELLARLEVAFQQREEALAQQQRFVADASHELRTPLTSILGYARMLRQWGLDDPIKAREGVAAIERQAARMNTLAEGMLSLAQGDCEVPLVLSEIDLREPVAEAMAAARMAADGKVALHYQAPATPVAVCCDRDRIQQVTRILLDNAIKYTPETGQVMVRLHDRDDVIELEVADTGIGIPPKHVPHVFERFYRADEARTEGGSGLGLAIAAQIVAQHGGTIGVRSQPGIGTTFCLRLPRVAVATDERACAPPATEEAIPLRPAD